MISVLVSSDPRYRANRKLIRKAIEQTLQDQHVTHDVEVSVAIVGNRKMRALCEQYLNDGQEHDVLSFPYQDGSSKGLFMTPPNDIIRLGDIVIAHPQAVKQAAEENVLVSEKLAELLEHAVMHLLGYHHDDYASGTV